MPLCGWNRCRRDGRIRKHDADRSTKTETATTSQSAGNNVGGLLTSAVVEGAVEPASGSSFATKLGRPPILPTKCRHLSENFRCDEAGFQGS